MENRGEMSGLCTVSYLKICEAFGFAIMKTENKEIGLV